MVSQHQCHGENLWSNAIGLVQPAFKGETCDEKSIFVLCVCGGGGGGGGRDEDQLRCH